MFYYKEKKIDLFVRSHHTSLLLIIFLKKHPMFYSLVLKVQYVGFNHLSLQMCIRPYSGFQVM